MNYPCTKASNKNNTKIALSFYGFNGCVFGSIVYGLLPDIKQIDSTGAGDALIIIICKYQIQSFLW